MIRNDEPSKALPSRDDVKNFLNRDRAWGRWGPDDQYGALNLIDDAKRKRAAGLVQTGQAISLSRDIPTEPGRGNPFPAQHYLKTMSKGDRAGAAFDYLGVLFHGLGCTHVDALCHMWDEEGMWNGRDATHEITFDGARWGGIQHWRNGIVTRGILLDVPGFRGCDYVVQDRPIHGWELADVCERQGTIPEPGDALIVYGGRERFDAENQRWGSSRDRPGVHASCLEFLRDADCSTLIWDMMDLIPFGYDLPFTVHGAIFAYGMAHVDNAYLGELAAACRSQGRYEFMVSIAPLPIVGGTGSPVNPIAIL
jgi:kynurenine formamidase